MKPLTQQASVARSYHLGSRRMFPLVAASSLVMFSSLPRGYGQTAPASGVASASGPTPASTMQPHDAAADLEAELSSLQGRPGGLTASQAAQRSVAVSSDITASRHREIAAEADLDAARIRYAPRLTLSAGYTRYSPIDAPSLGVLVVTTPDQANRPNPQPTLGHAFSFPVLLNQTTLRASLVVPLTDYFVKFPHLVDSAQSGINVARFNRLATQARAATNAKIAYFSWARAVLQGVTAEQAHRRARDHLRDTERAFGAGLATIADVRAVEAQVAQAELLKTRANNNVAITEEQVRVQLQLPPETRLEIGEVITTAPALPQVPRLEEAWQEAQQSRPELLALTQSEQQLRQQANAQLGGEFPRVDALGEVLGANPNPRYQPPVDAFKTTWAVGVQATWTVNDWPSNAAQRRALESQADALVAQREALKQGLRSEIVSASQGVAQAVVTIASTQRGVDAADTAYRVRRDQYIAGRATSVELTDAETELTRARIDHIDALVDARIAAARLEYALGRSSHPSPMVTKR